MLGCSILIISNMNKLTNIKHYKKEYVRALYGRYGKDSGLKPGIMWPRKEELLYLKQYEEAFCPKLEDLISEHKSKKEQAIKARQDREKDVLAKLEKLPAAFKSFFEKIEEKEQEQAQYLAKREAMIEEVRDILGFRADPSDEKFQQALTQKEEDERKATKKKMRLKKENANLDEMLGK